jgi:DNA-binding NarL/FixJ family response regulator
MEPRRASSATGNALGVLIVEDEQRTRQRLSAVIEAAPGFQLIAAVGSLQAAQQAVAARVPDVVLLDLGLPDGNGVSFIHHLRHQKMSSEVLVISVMGDERSVLGAIESGAGGYLLKDSSDRDVIAAIEQLCEGGAPLSPAIAVHLMRRLQAPASPVRDSGVQLSEREIELLRLIAKGLSYDEVGRTMGLRYNTVASYAKELYRKLQVHSRSEAIFEASQLGLVQISRS